MLKISISLQRSKMSRIKAITLFSIMALTGCVHVDSVKINTELTNPTYDRKMADRIIAKNSLVSIKVVNGDKHWHLGGILRIPYGYEGKKIPAVLIIHGSGGVDSRGAHYTSVLNKAGYATLEIDLWAARGVMSPDQRPKAVEETLPDTFAALDYLNSRPEIDGTKVGVMGFSWGGVVSMLSATKHYQEKYALKGEKFAAHAPFYPVCWLYNKVPGYEFGELTGARILLQAGRADTYDEPDTCEKLYVAQPAENQKLMVVNAYDNATHGWDRREKDQDIFDPYAALGKGGVVPLLYNPDVTQKATNALLKFFDENLK